MKYIYILSELNDTLYRYRCGRIEMFVPDFKNHELATLFEKSWGISGWLGTPDKLRLKDIDWTYFRILSKVEAESIVVLQELNK